MPKGNMTIVVVALVGIGALLLISAIENTSLSTTFQNIISSNPFNPNSPGPEGSTSNQCPYGNIYVLPAGQTQCPSGYTTGSLPGTCYCTYGGSPTKGSSV